MKVQQTNIQVEVLKTITKLYEQPATLDFINANPLIYTTLWEKINSKSVDIRNMALLSFGWLCRFQGPIGYNYILKAAQNYAKQMNKSPFTELIYSMNKTWETKVRARALELINALIVKCPSEKKLAKFLAHLENIGLYEELRSLSEIKNETSITNLLQNFQVSTK